MKHKTLVLIEEIFNSITHGIGALATLGGLIYLLVTANDPSPLKITGLLIFGISLFIMFLFSTLYHSLTYTRAQKVFIILDRSAIFLLIAATVTPIVLLVVNNLFGWIMLGLIWAIAITGITLHAIFPKKHEYLYIPVYLGMGWIGASLFQSLASQTSNQTAWLVILGGIFYSLGTIFHEWKKLPFNHTIWHLFVLAGAFCHFMVVASLL